MSEKGQAKEQGSEDKDQNRGLAVLKNRGKNNLQQQQQKQKVFGRTTKKSLWVDICNVCTIMSDAKGLTTCWVPQRGHTVIYPSQEGL